MGSPGWRMLRARGLIPLNGTASPGRAGSAREGRGAKGEKKTVGRQTKGGKAPSRRHLEKPEPLDKARGPQHPLF